MLIPFSEKEKKNTFSLVKRVIIIIIIFGDTLVRWTLGWRITRFFF